MSIILSQERNNLGRRADNQPASHIVGLGPSERSGDDYLEGE